MYSQSPGHAALESAETLIRASTPAGPFREAETRVARDFHLARETGHRCTDDSSEEAKDTTMDILIWLTASNRTKGCPQRRASSDKPSSPPSRASESGASSDGPHPVITLSRASESGASSDGPHPVITPSWSPGSDVTLLAEALVTVTHIEVINCSITEIETMTSSIPGASDTDLIPTEGVKASSTSDPPALPDSTDAKPHITEATASAKTLSTAGTTESATPDATVGTPLPTNSTIEREVTAPRATTLSGALATGNPLEETSALSVETPSYVKVSGAAPVSIEAGSAVGKTTSFAGSSASSYSPSEAALKNFTPSETLTTDIATKGPFPTSRDPLPSVPPTTTNSSRGTNSTLAKTTTSAKTTMKRPTATPTTARTRPTTDVSAGKWLLLVIFGDLGCGVSRTPEKWFAVSALPVTTR
uniref:MUC20 n=1 Tax=Pan troglodytes TaxID=9598 RepID=A0A2I3S566_PANTR